MRRSKERSIARELILMGTKPEVLTQNEADTLFRNMPIPKDQLDQRELESVTPLTHEISELVANWKRYQYERAIQKIASRVATPADIRYIRRINSR